jgi:hypothetical protein
MRGAVQGKWWVAGGLACALALAMVGARSAWADETLPECPADQGNAQTSDGGDAGGTDVDAALCFRPGLARTGYGDCTVSAPGAPASAAAAAALLATAALVRRFRARGR